LRKTVSERCKKAMLVHPIVICRHKADDDDTHMPSSNDEGKDEDDDSEEETTTNMVMVRKVEALSGFTGEQDGDISASRKARF